MKKNRIFYIALFMCSAIYINAQIPVNDAAWSVQSTMSDGFSGTSVNTTMWDTTYNWYGISNVANGAEWDYGRNDSVGGGYLYIKADTIKPPYKVAAWGTFPHYKYGTWGQSLSYAYQGGMVQTHNVNYTFGYIEISAKFPSKKWPLWPAFWMINGVCPPSPDFLNEVDMAENSALQSFEGNHVGNNYHVSAITCSYDSTDTYNVGTDVTVLPSTDSLSGAFHKYSFEWNPHRMTYYFDDVATTEIVDPTGARIPQHAMRIILAFGIEPWHSYLPNNWNNDTTYGFPVQHGDQTPTKWPQYFIINYINYYTLAVACTTTLSICTPSDYSLRKVQQNITVGGGTCTPNFNPTTSGASYTLRATDYVLLDAGTIINPSGSGYFAIDILPCPQ